MKSEKLVQIKGSTWYIDSIVTMPVYFLNDKDVILIDSGYKDKDRANIQEVIESWGLNVKAAIASHTHIDHTGNFAWLRENYKTELIMNDVEAAISADSDFISYLYRPTHTFILKPEVEHIFVKPDRVYSKDDNEIEICGAKFKLIPAPGHTLGQTLIVTPDEVCYIADAIISESMLESSKMLTSMDWSNDFKSREMLLGLDYPKYVLAHSGVYDDIKDLVAKNNLKRQNLSAFVLNVLKGREEWTISEIERAVYKALDMHTTKNHQMSIFRRNLSCLLEYLVHEELLKWAFKEGTLVYFVV